MSVRGWVCRAAAAGALVLLAAGPATAEPDEGDTASDAQLPPPIVRRIRRGQPLPGPQPAQPITPPQPPAPGFPAPAPAPVPQPTAPGFPAPAPAPTPDVPGPLDPPPPPGSLPPPIVRVVTPGSPLAPPLTLPEPDAPGTGLGPISEADGFAADLPDEPPPPPSARGTPTPGEVSFDVARPGGTMRVRIDPDDPEHGRIITLLGNPRIYRPQHVKLENGQQVTYDPLEIKANAIVAWVDRRGFQGLSPGAAFSLFPGASALEEKPEETPLLGSSASVVPAFLRAIYAEGAVELRFGEGRLRAERLYLEPHTYRGLFLQPRLEGRARSGDTGPEGVPLLVRAEEGRLIGRGELLFDQAEVTTSPSDDRVRLRVRSLTVEEQAERLAQGEPEPPNFVGFQASSTQRYNAREIVIEGERIPLFFSPEADFDSNAIDDFPTIIEDIRFGSIGHLGRFAFLKLGGPLVEQRQDRDVRWGLEVGGYTDRGPALGAETKWLLRRPDGSQLSYGWIAGNSVYDFDGVDRDGFVAPNDVRGRLTAESRTHIIEDLLLFDVEVNKFSDRGYNLEYHERDQLEHKDRETYARLYWKPKRPGNVVTIGMVGAHLRPFETETVEQPSVGLWVASAPLLTPRRRGGLGIDVTSFSKAGRFDHQIDNALMMPSYSAWRLSSDTRVHAAMSQGDVRFSSFFGATVDHYEDVSNPDYNDRITRGGMVAGARANVQLSRAYRARGGPMQLDGLRHVIDSDVGYDGRFGSDKTVEDVPFFDLREQEEDRHALRLAVRNRLQTRRKGTIATILNFEVIVRKWFDNRGPYLRPAPGTIDFYLSANPARGVQVVGEAEVDLDGVPQTSFLNAQYETEVNDQPFLVSAGLRTVREQSLALTNELRWRINERYQLEYLQNIDFREGGEPLPRAGPAHQPRPRVRLRPEHAR